MVCASACIDSDNNKKEKIGRTSTFWATTLRREVNIRSKRWSSAYIFQVVVFPLIRSRLCLVIKQAIIRPSCFLLYPLWLLHGFCGYLWVAEKSLVLNIQHKLHLWIYYMSKLLNRSEFINTINSRHMLSRNP
jgi:hypothetical protein